MRPETCRLCGGSGKDENSTRRLPCTLCSGRGFRWLPGHDRWGGYRATYNIEVTPSRLTLEEQIDDMG